MKIIYTIQELKEELDKKQYNTISKKHTLYISDCICSFDIETSSLYQNEKTLVYISNKEYQELTIKQQKEYKKIAFMYIFQFLIDDCLFIGRDWNIFVDVCFFLSSYFNLMYEDKHLIIYVHNLSYEFQFMNKWLNFIDVFAIKERKPIKATTLNGLEFRCSYLLSGYSLDTLSKNLQKHEIKKLVGDLDYNLIRHNKTPIEYKELEYCINDVLIVKYYIEECIERFKNIALIPLTQTGIVRNYVRNYTMKNKKYYFWIKTITMETEEFKTLKRAFSGGYTHANIKHVGNIEKNVSSIDFTSSYPYALMSEKYPMSKGRKLNYSMNYKSFDLMLQNNLAVFDVTFYNIKSKYMINIISSHKCYEKENVRIDNGKIISADKIKLSVTNIDFSDIKDFYDFENCDISNVWIYEKNYLPKNFLECVIKFYSDKTTLKGVEGKEKEYLHGKEMLNSLYGMCVTNIIRDDIVYTKGEWKLEECNIDEKIENYNQDKRRFLCYIWGVFCTSYARHNLYSGILEFKNDFIYCDTDSIKCLNYENHLEYVNKYNENCVKKLNAMCDYHGLNYDVYKPKTIKGKEKILGVWDFEETYKRFKTLGSKRYIFEDSEKIEIVVSGLGKNAIKELQKKYSNDEIFELFNIGLHLERGEVGKMTHTYIDDNISGELLDYQNNKGSYNEKSFIHLEETDFLLGLSDDFIELIIQLGNKSLFDKTIKNF